MRKALAILYLVVWLSTIIGAGVLSYQAITDRGDAWTEAHPEYCTYQYDYRCGQKNPWGVVLFSWMWVFPLSVCFASAYVNPLVTRSIDRRFPKNAN